jgi:hypothetical protein
VVGKRQKMIRLELAFPEGGRGEDPKASAEGTEPTMAGRRPESPACITSRTAVYGPVRTVVWEGGAVSLLPIPIPFVSFLKPD